MGEFLANCPLGSNDPALPDLHKSVLEIDSSSELFNKHCNLMAKIDYRSVLQACQTMSTSIYGTKSKR